MSTLSPAQYRWSEKFEGLYWLAPDGLHFISAQELEDMPRDVYQSYFGKRVEGVIIDDPLNDSKPKKKDYNTIAVRYLRGPNLHKAYTYRVKKGVKLHLGQEVIVPTQVDGYVAQNVAVVVELHKTPQDNGPYDYKFVYGTVKPL
jgi:hypothetical protein